MSNSNEMRFNERTMVEMVQHYFATKMFRPEGCPTVAAVKSGRKAQGENTFVVMLESENGSDRADAPAL